MTEKEIQNSILYWLNFQPGCFAMQVTTSGVWDAKGKFYRNPGKYVPKGCADIIFCLNGTFGAIEVKTPEAYKKFLKNPGDHELRQQAFLHQITSKGGFAQVVCSLDQVIEAIKKLTIVHLK